MKIHLILFHGWLCSMVQSGNLLWKAKACLLPFTAHAGDVHGLSMGHSAAFDARAASDRGVSLRATGLLPSEWRRPLQKMQPCGPMMLPVHDEKCIRYWYTTVTNVRIPGEARLSAL